MLIIPIIHIYGYQTLVFLKTLLCTIEITRPTCPRTPAASPSAPHGGWINHIHLFHVPHSQKYKPTLSLRSKTPLSLFLGMIVNQLVLVRFLLIFSILSLSQLQYEGEKLSECQFVLLFHQIRTLNVHRLPMSSIQQPIVIFLQLIPTWFMTICKVQYHLISSLALYIHP